MSWSMASRAMAPASTVHGFLQGELARLIGNHLREAAPECEVVANPGVVPRLLSEHNVRIPDLAVSCSPLAAGQATLADPVLLIEILSPSNQAKTWTNFWAYTSIASVQEIWFCAPIEFLPNCCAVRRKASGPSTR